MFFFLSGKEGQGICFFSSLKMSKQKKTWDIAAFSWCKDETSHLLRASVVVSSAERSRRKLKVTRPNSRVPFITHFQYRWFLGAKAEMSSFRISWRSHFPTPTNHPLQKNRWCFEIFYIFPPKTWGKIANLMIIFFRWGGEKIQPPKRPKKTLRQKTTNCHAVNQPEKNAGQIGSESGYNWKNVHDDLEAGRPEMMVCNYLEFVEEVDLGVS